MDTKGRILAWLTGPAIAQLEQPLRTILPLRWPLRVVREPAMPMVSVIIPAHNEEAYLRHTLDALKAQNYPRFEVIVVANGCMDNTASVARGHCDRLIIISQKALGIARNLGARMARGELLVFLDADTMLDPDALASIASEFTQGCAAGTLKTRPDCERPAYRLLYWLKNLMHRCRLYKGSAGVIICWKKHFETAGGFDEALQVRENSELIKRLNCFGRYKCIADTLAVTSMRRYQKRGFGRTTWLWMKLWIQSGYSDLRGRDYETVR